LQILTFNNKNEGSNPVKKKNSVHMATGNDENVDGDENDKIKQASARAELSWKDFNNAYDFLFRNISKHHKIFETGLVASNWFRSTLHQFRTIDRFPALRLSVQKLFKLALMYTIFNHIRNVLVEQWLKYSAPKISLDFNGLYCVVKRLFTLKALVALDIPRVLHVSFNFKVSNDKSNLLEYPSNCVTEAAGTIETRDREKALDMIEVDECNEDASVSLQQSPSSADEKNIVGRQLQPRSFLDEIRKFKKFSSSPIENMEIGKIEAKPILGGSPAIKKPLQSKLRTKVLPKTNSPMIHLDNIQLKVGGSTPTISTPDLFNAPPRFSTVKRSRMSVVSTTPSSIRSKESPAEKKTTKMTGNSLFDQIRNFNSSGLTPSCNRALREIQPDQTKTKSLFGELSASLSKRRSRLSTAVFAKNTREVYEDGDEDDSISSTTFDGEEDDQDFNFGQEDGLNPNDITVDEIENASAICSKSLEGGNEENIENMSPSPIVDKRLSSAHKNVFLSRSSGRRRSRQQVYVPSALSTSESDD
jgi:hypothetical protein